MSEYFEDVFRRVYTNAIGITVAEFHRGLAVIDGNNNMSYTFCLSKKYLLQRIANRVALGQSVIQEKAALSAIEEYDANR